MLALFLKFIYMVETAGGPPSSFIMDSSNLAEHIAMLNKIYVFQPVLRLDLGCNEILVNGVQVGVI